MKKLKRGSGKNADLLYLLVDMDDKWKGGPGMKEIYRKTSKVSFIGGIGAAIFGIIFYIYGYEDFSCKWRYFS